MRFISLTDELKQQALEDFKEKLEQERFSDTKISFSFDLANANTLQDDQKVILNVRPTAWLKMWSLVQTESKEIGWHGLITRHADKIFELTDIMMYPQVTTAATVVTDDVEYGNWLHKEISDEDINHLRFHGHSHVNMSTHPSGVDTTWYNEILQSLMNDDFYIFMILNKKEDYFIEIYDLATNTIYEKKDIIINVIMEDNNYLTNWVEKEKERYIKEPLKPTYGFGERLPSLDDIKRFDAYDELEEEYNFRDLLLNLTSEDFKDLPLVQGIITELNKSAAYTGYYGVGWHQWNFMTRDEKIETAQEYYTKHPSPNVSSKKKGRPRKNKSYGGSFYD